ncbi:MAG: hypothetical protein AAGD25_11605 [Cyanobacteria bacterium P01_F01_bin.150]
MAPEKARNHVIPLLGPNGAKVHDSEKMRGQRFVSQPGSEGSA